MHFLPGGAARRGVTVVIVVVLLFLTSIHSFCIVLFWFGFVLPPLRYNRTKRADPEIGVLCPPRLILSPDTGVIRKVHRVRLLHVCV